MARDGKFDVRLLGGAGAGLGRTIVHDGSRAKWAAGTDVIGFYRDRFAATGAVTTLTLTYAPITHSLHLYLNGTVLDEGTDYTLTDDTVAVSATTTSGDILDAKYAYAASSTAGTPGAGYTTTFTDNFNRANSTSTLGSPWFTQAREVTATWGISSNKAYVVSCPLAPSFTWWEGLALIDTGTADFDMSVTVTWTGSRQPIMAWRVSQDRDGTTNKPSFFVVSADSSYGAGKYATGSGLSTLASGTNFNSGDVCRVTCVGNAHTVYKNGVSVYSFTDTMNNTETWHGLAGVDPALGDNRYDDFSITY